MVRQQRMHMRTMPRMAEFFRKAAEQGEAIAQFNLGNMYVQGHGVAKDYVQAHLWLSLSAAQGDEDALKLRNRIARQMTSAQISEAERLAWEWNPQP